MAGFVRDKPFGPPAHHPDTWDTPPMPYAADDHAHTPILDRLLWEARHGGIRRARHCADELSANPGEVHTCGQDPGHGGDHVTADGHLTRSVVSDPRNL